MFKIFDKKKPTLDDLLMELTNAQSKLDEETSLFSAIEARYQSSIQDYLKAKHDYEDALAEYSRFGGEEYALKEAQARQNYGGESRFYSDNVLAYQEQAKRVKKAEKVYKKLQAKVAKLAEDQQMGR